MDDAVMMAVPAVLCGIAGYLFGVDSTRRRTQEAMDSAGEILTFMLHRAQVRGKLTNEQTEAIVADVAARYDQFSARKESAR